MATNAGNIKAIYSDWNIFQDIIQDRKSSRLVENLNAGRNKGYLTPYSHAHISDLLRCSNASYIKNDLEQLEIITGKWCIGQHKNGSGFCVDKMPPGLVYEAMEADQKNTPELKGFKFEFQSYIVDVAKLSGENVLVPFLERFHGVMSPELLESFVDHLQENGLADHKLQRGFRNSLIEVVRLNHPAAEEIREWPIYSYLLSTPEEIERNFISIFQSFLSVDGRSIDTISEEDKFTIAYGILDFFPVFKEKIEKKNNLNNMFTDALHVYIASKCSYFICGDKKSVAKAKIIYRAFQVKTKIYYVDDFINNVEL
ncbi:MULTISPECIES: hypothetical protein [unclassified Pseudomonas]|uniref:hypothetical protein n=1 Tax=unclassified Pseudomonas TaxID=196821 RepID=UPI002892A24E|nr:MULTISPECIES: hypothetical protein [unclassified Pseudomonas]